MARVLVAMSGGVDSSVAAALLVEDGHDVTGVHLKVGDRAADTGPGHGCCTLDDAQDARRAAQVLGIPFYVWDVTETFVREVERPFAAAYAAGATPNPCITCNARVKHGALVARARALGFDAVATGHHARIVRDGRTATVPGTGAELWRGRDAAKDQSYVLHVATAEELEATLLPVGELTKAEVRARAAALDLRVAAKPDSYEVCFVPPGGTGAYLARELGRAPGSVVDLDGTELGRHEGVWGFTVGQRKGLGLGRHERQYVVDLDAPTRTVVVGPRSALACSWVELAAPTWTTGGRPDGPWRAQVRAHAPSVAVAEVGPAGADGTGVRLRLAEPVEGVAVGQSVALYDDADRRCLGGGAIVAAERPARGDGARGDGARGASARGEGARADARRGA